VDVGANVGYSVILLLFGYPHVHVEAFEPHPDFVLCLRRNLDLNGLAGRVVIDEAAAATGGGEAYLIEAGTMTNISDDNDGNSLGVKSVHF
jgi:FkbM family methyltransferase